MPLDGILHRAGEDLAVGDVVFAATDDRTDALDAEAQVGTGSLEMDFVSAIHQCLECLHARDHPGVVQRADSEEEFSESLGAHLCLLGHRRSGPPENDPAGLVDPVVEGRAELRGEHCHLRLRHISHLGDVLRAAHGDVGLHLLESCQIDIGHCCRLRAGHTKREFTTDPP